ncbi:PepSY domain-containing protein [Planococcus dechangensis]|uniref:PepSY domain-containing protein n=1 Tax=Planococcus dechangensis TaxID=1176255 RepID=A0ABV9MAW2_9BACL
MKNSWMRVIAGTVIVGGIGGASVVGASALNTAKAPKVSAEKALQEVFAKVEGTVQEVELSFEEGRYYEVEVESSTHEYEFTIDAASGEFLEQASDQETAPDSGFSRPVDAANYAEFAMIEKNVNTDSLTYHLATDNPGNRILFLLNENGQKQFKTIYLKHSRELEIIDLHNGKRVYQGKI